MFEVKQLNKCYGNKIIFKNASFKAEYGNIVGLLGKNGVGKTTFFNCITGVCDSSILNADEIKHTRFSYMPRFEQGEWNDTISDLARLLPVISDGFDKEYFKQKTDEIFKGKNLQLKALSTGERVALEFIITLSRNAQVYLFDEPFANLDSHYREFIKRELISNYSDDKLFIISSHDIAELEMLFSHVAIIKDHGISGLYDCERIRESGDTVNEFFMRETI